MQDSARKEKGRENYPILERNKIRRILVRRWKHAEVDQSISTEIPCNSPGVSGFMRHQSRGALERAREEVASDTKYESIKENEGSSKPSAKATRLTKGC